MSEIRLQDNFIDIEPYVAGEQLEGDVVKLNTNENPYPPSQMAVDAIRNYTFDSLRKYPRSSSNELRRALAAEQGLPEDYVFTANGSDEVLALAFRSFFNSNMPILFPDITYSFYPVWCKLLGIAFTKIPVKDDFNIDETDYKVENGGIVIANPNAPTGIGRGEAFVRFILDNNKNVIVIMDEAYADFAEFSAVSMIKEYDNLLVTGSFSKGRSLAGLRIGMAYGSPELIRVLDTVKDSFNSYPIDMLAEAAGTASVLDRKYYNECCQRICKTRESAKATLEKLGFYVLPSSANFIFATHSKVDAKSLYVFLKGKKILVRHFDKPRIDQYLRISIGTDDEMECLVKAICDYLGKERG